MKIKAPSNAPAWATELTQSIERAVRGPRDAPLGLAAYPSTALPAASEWVNSAVWISDIKRLAVSDGTNWIGLGVFPHRA